MPTEGDVDDSPAAEAERPAQVAVPTAGGDTDVVTETPSSDPTTQPASSEEATAGGPGEEPTSTQTETASETSQAEG